MSLSKVAALSVAMAAFVAPVASHADASSAFDACVKSFIESKLPKAQQVSVRKNIPYTSTVLALQPKSYTIDLVAQEVKSGAEIAQARCVADRRGRVLVLGEDGFGSTTQKADMVAAVVTR